MNALIKVLNHKAFRLTLIILCLIYILLYILEITNEQNILSLDDVIPTFFENNDKITHKTHQTNDVLYTKQKPLKIRIAIPSSFSDKDAMLRNMQRLSWLKYLNQSNALWESMHCQCEISYHYFIGISHDLSQNLKIKRESDIYNDIIQMNFSEDWNNLQSKTIDIIHWEYLSKNSENNTFDLLLKTDTDSYVNLPNLCTFMSKIMNGNGWNGQSNALYLGVLREGSLVQTDIGNKYENSEWIKRIKKTKYSPFMAGFGYFITHKTAEIIYDSLHKTKESIAFNRLEDTYLGHYLTSFDVTYVNIDKTIDPYPKPNVFSLNNHIIDHMYDNALKAQFMIDKYKMHSRLHKQYLDNKRQENDVGGDEYNPKLLLL